MNTNTKRSGRACNPLRPALGVKVIGAVSALSMSAWKDTLGARVTDSHRATPSSTDSPKAKGAGIKPGNMLSDSTPHRGDFRGKK